MVGLLNRQDLLTAYTEYLETKSRATIDAQWTAWIGTNKEKRGGECTHD